MTQFWKLHGIGNDFVFLEPGASPTVELIRELCSRESGVGSDGLITLDSIKSPVATMRMWNPDGSESGMCGNGLRCAALWLNLHHSHQHVWQIWLGGKAYEVQTVERDRFAVKIGQAVVSSNPVTCQLGETSVSGIAVDVGNPHLVIFVEDDPSTHLSHGLKLEHHASFPNRTNVHFAFVHDGEITMVTWERGAGPTLACGSGACAVAAAATALHGTSSDWLVHLPGGDLKIDGAHDSITMIGPAELVFQGEFSSSTCH
ncbi:MAG: diaminopimelate epimerase [Chthonomonas sp.]|nr:diaminopimelate epimerase [Chthonomonas sp.]